MTNKKTLREEAIKSRAWIQAQADDAEKAKTLFFDSVQPGPDQIIAAYWPKEREFDPIETLEEAHRRKMICALPKIQNGSKILKFHQWAPNAQLQVGPMGILQPEEGEALLPDIVIVPLLAFDRQGHRLGYGGGYYDATLKYLRTQKDILAVGFAYAKQACLFNLPSEVHDEALDMVITPQDIHRF